MIRILALAALMLLAAASPVRDWSVVSTMKPDGAYVIGKPDARVRLVEYSSYTCPHCGAFVAAATATLDDRYIRSGSTSLEIRPVVRDRLDLAAAIVARCGGVQLFAGNHRAIFAAQDDWLAKGTDWDQGNASRIAAYPLGDQLSALADGAGLTAIGRSRALSSAALTSCFADRASIDKLVALSGTMPSSVTGTPSFAIDGRLTDAHDWTRLQPLLHRAGAR